MMIRSIFPVRRVAPPFLLFMTGFLSVVLLAGIPSMAEGEEWRLVSKADGISVHKRIREGSGFFEFKAVGDLRGAVSGYVSVLLDTDKMPDWDPQCFEARNVEYVDEHETIIYVACNGVWPVSDRDYVARRTVISDSDMSTVRVNIDRIDYPNMLVIKSRVHIPRLRCIWIFERIDIVHTRVELHAYVDPGGRLPPWLVNWGYSKIPYRYLKDLEAKVVERMYCSEQLVSALITR